MADVLATHLQTQAVGALGTSLFIDYMPDSPDAQVAVFELAGLGPSYVLDKGEPLVQTRVQVFARGAARDYQGPRQKATDVAAALRPIMGTTLSGLRIVEMSATDNPHLHERDGKERVVFTQFWEVTHER